MVPGTQARSRFFKGKKRLTNGMKVKIHGGAEDENDKDSNLGFLKVENYHLRFAIKNLVSCEVVVQVKICVTSLWYNSSSTIIWTNTLDNQNLV